MAAATTAEKGEFSESLRGLKADFLRRDKKRCPDGWRLPPDSECGDSYKRPVSPGGGC
jgi:hypothetical protein